MTSLAYCEESGKTQREYLILLLALCNDVFPRLFDLVIDDVCEKVWETYKAMHMRDFWVYANKESEACASK